MAHAQIRLAGGDPIWTQLRSEAEAAVADEPILGGMIHSGVLYQNNFERALAYRISLKLSTGEMPAPVLCEIAEEAIMADPRISDAARADLMAVYDRDPACHSMLQALLYFKGYIALQCYRIGHWLWTENRHDLAYFVQMRMSEIFAVDVHPGAKIGSGIMMDHAHGVVIGETAVVGNNVSILHSVTLGGTGKEEGDRHPKIGDGVLIGAGAKILGNISIGECARVAAGSVVLKNVPACTTVAGVPAKVIGGCNCENPAEEMDQLLTSD